jgi:MFS family permease
VTSTPRGGSSASVELTAHDRAALQRRTLRVLTVGQIFGAASTGSAITIGAFVVQDILGQDTAWGGIATTSVTLGTAFMAQALSRVMLRRGRRPGLQLGYTVAALGALVAGFGAEQGWLLAFIVGLFLFGTGQATNLLSRYAAADLADPRHRGRAMSRVVFASTFGAVFGPVLIGPAEYAGEAWFDLGRYTGPWLVSSAFFLIAAVNAAVRLRPDPLVVAGGIVAAGGPGSKAPALRDVLRLVAAIPRARLALVAMVVSQATMVAVMTMTPMHMRLHGHESLSQYVVSLHVAGMYAFSPLIGRYVDKRGRLPAIVAGAAVLMAASLLAALAGEAQLLLFPALWALGLGWNFGLIAGSTLLTESVPSQDRVAVQGSADLMMSFCGGMAGFASGFVRRAFGYHVLAGLAAVLAGGLLVVAYVAQRRTPRRAPEPALEAIA